MKLTVLAASVQFSGQIGWWKSIIVSFLSTSSPCSSGILGFPCKKEKMVPFITKLLEHDKSSWGPNFDCKNNDWQQLNLSGVSSSSSRVSFVDETQVHAPP